MCCLQAVPKFGAWNDGGAENRSDFRHYARSFHRVRIQRSITHGGRRHPRSSNLPNDSRGIHSQSASQASTSSEALAVEGTAMETRTQESQVDSRSCGKSPALSGIEQGEADSDGSLLLTTMTSSSASSSRVPASQSGVASQASGETGKLISGTYPDLGSSSTDSTNSASAVEDTWSIWSNSDREAQSDSDDESGSVQQRRIQSFKLWIPRNASATLKQPLQSGRESTTAALLRPCDIASDSRELSKSTGGKPRLFRRLTGTFWFAFQKRVKWIKGAK